MVIIDAELTAPPSEVVLFRDITMYSNVFLKKPVLLECRKEERDFYYKWLKNRASWDFVVDFIKPNTELGISIRKDKANIIVERISYQNFDMIINKLTI